MKKIFVIIMASILFMNISMGYYPTNIDKQIIESVKIKVDEIWSESRDGLLKLEKSLTSIKEIASSTSRNRYIIWELLNYINNKLNQIPEGNIRILDQFMQWDENDAAYTPSFHLKTWEYKISANMLGINSNKIILASKSGWAIKTLISSSWPIYGETAKFSITREWYYIFNIQTNWYRNLYTTKWDNTIDRIWIIQDN